ncbi:hypothetical protein [Rufibacter tibetensis]|uniref:Uncharacterized protein n=1 Tax=Rufibacter tibetensis TaxID=512763 RepID=A0A0P0D3Z1_9BACT|nr:hypothetical protein [Rufibacter tibetensis]ALJ01781.1 hypothetical protein DC20_22205 [Rufibacter tibetensis]
MQSSSSEKGVSKLEAAMDAASDLSMDNRLASSTNISGLRSDSLNLGSSSNQFLSPQEGISKITNQRRSSQTYIVSDFQRSTFSPEVLTDLPKEQAITLVSLSTTDIPNLYIDSVWLEQPVLLPNSLAGISVRVAGSNLDESNQVKVTASEDGKLLGATQVLLEPGNKAIAHFKIPLASGTAQQITFEVEDPTTSYDNQYFIVLPEPSSVQLKLNRAQGQNDPIAQAYKAEPAFVFSSDVTRPNGLWVVDIPAGASSRLIQQIYDWIGRGGNVLLIPSATASQKGAVDFLAKIGLKGISEESQETGPKPLIQPDLSDAFFRQVFEKEVKNMKMPEAKPVLTWRSSFHNILKFTDNTPFLSTFRIGKGNVHLFASPINNASSFVAHPLFVPVLYQLALSFDVSRTVLAHQANRGTINIPLENEVVSKQPYSLTMGDQSFIPDQRVRQDMLHMTLPNDVSTPGFYTLVREGKAISTIALNIPREESRLEGYTVEELKEILAGHGDNVQVIEPKETVSLQKQLQTEASGASLWKYCLILCFLCLVIEAVILSAKKSGSVI